MSTYLYAYPAPLVFTVVDPKPGYMVFDQEIGGQYVYMSARPLSYPNQTLVGAWNSDGTVLLDGVGDPIPIDPLFDSLRPVGNLDGEATAVLLHHYFLGHHPRWVQPVPVVDTLPEYPADNQPIVLTMVRRWDNTPGNEGWSWVATIEFSDPNRDPSVRSIAIWDEGHVTQLYQTAAFNWTDTGEVDENGDPIFKWQNFNPPGFATATKEPIFYSMLWASVPEGRSTLPEGVDSQIQYFWESNQGGGTAWVDTGETVVQMAGNVTLVTDNAPFTDNDLVRINGNEFTVTSLYYGAFDGLVLDPYIISPVGAVIELWQ